MGQHLTQTRKHILPIFQEQVLIPSLLINVKLRRKMPTPKIYHKLLNYFIVEGEIIWLIQQIYIFQNCYFFQYVIEHLFGVRINKGFYACHAEDVVTEVELFWDEDVLAVEVLVFGYGGEVYDAVEEIGADALYYLIAFVLKGF